MTKHQRQCQAYLNSLKDMHNIAVKSYNDAKDEYQKQLGLSLIATVDACIDSFTKEFNIPKCETTKELIQ
jgi:hypothetical protein